MPEPQQKLTKIMQQQEQAKHLCGVRWINFQPDQFPRVASDQELIWKR